MFFDFLNKKTRNKKIIDTTITQSPADTGLVPEKDNGEPSDSKYHIFKKLEKGIPLPEKLVDFLPNPDMIIITSYGDGKTSNGKRLHIGLRKISSDEKFIQYQIKPTHNSSYSISDEVFGCSFHPFIRNFTDNVIVCSENILRSLHFKPYFFEVSQNTLCVSFNGGYYNTEYEETPTHIEYNESYQESYHDGGGSGSLEWGLYATDKKEEKPDLLHDEKMNGIKLPLCKGYWFENNHLYLVDPWGLSGVFEYYHNKNTRDDYDSDNRCCTIGVKPDLKAAIASVIFTDACTVDVTNFDTSSPDDELGYVCKDNIVLFSDGNITLSKESFTAKEILKCYTNINNHDLRFVNDVRIIINNKSIQITFDTLDTKQRFIDRLSVLLSNHTI